MAIDYIVSKACTPRTDLDNEGIIHLIKSKSRAQALFERFLADDMTEEEAMNASFGIQTYRANGEPEMKEVSVRSLFKQAELLEDYEQHCADCPVAAGRPFGCYDSINYPITAKAEKWLATMAAKAIHAGLPNSILVKFILDQNVRGDAFQGMRSGHQFTYTELEQPLEIVVEQEGEPDMVIHTSQLLDMFFAIGEMKEVHQQFLLFFSGGLTIQKDPPEAGKFGPDVQAAALTGNDGSSSYWIYSIPDELNDDQSIRQIKSFLRSLFAAQCSQADMVIDF